MKVGYYHGYKDGLAEGRLQAIQEFERILALCNEALSDMQRDRDSQMHRADAAADLLLQHLGTRAISLAGQHEEVARQERHINTVRTLAAIPDPTEELPYGHPNGLYKSASEAALIGEDVASSEG